MLALDSACAPLLHACQTATGSATVHHGTLTVDGSIATAAATIAAAAMKDAPAPYRQATLLLVLALLSYCCCYRCWWRPSYSLNKTTTDIELPQDDAQLLQLPVAVRLACTEVHVQLTFVERTANAR